MAKRNDNNLFGDRYGEVTTLQVYDNGDGIDLMMNTRSGGANMEQVFGVRNDDLDRLENLIHSIRAKRNL
jgi:hypothetical protein